MAALWSSTEAALSARSGRSSNGDAVVQRRVNRATTAWRLGRVADDEPRRSHGQGATPLALRLNDLFGGTIGRGKGYRTAVLWRCSRAPSAEPRLALSDRQSRDGGLR